MKHMQPNPKTEVIKKNTRTEQRKEGEAEKRARKRQANLESQANFTLPSNNLVKSLNDLLCIYL